jgi:hypothetical protein
MNMRFFRDFMVIFTWFIGFSLITFQWILYMQGMNVELEPETQLFLCLIGTACLAFVIGVSAKRVPSDAIIVRFATFSTKAFLPGVDRWYFLFYGAHTEARMTVGPHSHYYRLNLGSTADLRSIDCVGSVTFSLMEDKESLPLAASILKEGGTEKKNLGEALQIFLENELKPDLKSKINALGMQKIGHLQKALIAETQTDIRDLYRKNGMLVKESTVRFYITDLLHSEPEDDV